MPLSRVVDVVQATVSTLQTRGLTQARITLTPGSLGEVRVVLTQTANGLTARVIADHGDAAQTLMQSADELRGRLEAGGTTLLRLDIGTSEQAGTGAGGGSGPDTPGTAQQGPDDRGADANPGTGSGANTGTGSNPGTGSGANPGSGSHTGGPSGEHDEADPDAQESLQRITVAWGDSSLVNVLA